MSRKSQIPPVTVDELLDIASRADLCPSWCAWHTRWGSGTHGGEAPVDGQSIYRTHHSADQALHGYSVRLVEEVDSWTRQHHHWEPSFEGPPVPPRVELAARENFVPFISAGVPTSWTGEREQEQHVRNEEHFDDCADWCVRHHETWEGDRLVTRIHYSSDEECFIVSQVTDYPEGGDPESEAPQIRLEFDYISPTELPGAIAELEKLRDSIDDIWYLELMEM